jgi:DNA polymerase delta subunit 2
MKECPHVYFVGNQPKFSTTMIEGPAGQFVRLVTIPKFKETGVLVLVDTETLEVECVKFKVHRKPEVKGEMDQKIVNGT